MKALILASDAVLTLGFGPAFVATKDTAQQSQQPLAMSGQASGAQTGSPAVHATGQQHPHVGGWEPLPPNCASGGD